MARNTPAEPLASAPAPPLVSKVSTRPRTAAGDVTVASDAPATPRPAGPKVEPHPQTVARPLPMGLGWSATVAHGVEATGVGRWSVAIRGGSSNALLTVLALTALFLSATAMATRQRRSAKAPDEISDQRADDGLPPELPTSETTSFAPPPPPPPLPRACRPSEAPDAHSQLVSPRTKPPPVPRLPPSDWNAVVELGTTAAALLDIVQQMIADHVPDGPLREVLDNDLVTTAARLGGSELATALEDGRLDLAHPVYAQAILDLERVRTLARIEYERTQSVSGELSHLPTTFDDACDFLGVNPRASTVVVKKVVDALRQNWHPDLAADETERAAREERTKCINAAWDLIRAR